MRIRNTDFILCVCLGIGSGAGAAEQEAATASLLELWREVESLMEQGQVGGAGFCDLHPPIFMALYEEATTKPTSVQVHHLIDISQYRLLFGFSLL
jgi:diketogulonate reductase-like aldo/keto reductase